MYLFMRGEASPLPSDLRRANACSASARPPQVFRHPPLWGVAAPEGIIDAPPPGIYHGGSRLNHKEPQMNADVTDGHGFRTPHNPWNLGNLRAFFIWAVIYGAIRG